MPFEKGQIGNPKGRPKGSRNKTAIELKEILFEVISNETDSLLNRLNNLPDKDRIELLIKLLPFVLPKCSNENINVSFDDGINIPLIEWVK